MFLDSKIHCLTLEPKKRSVEQKTSESQTIEIKSETKTIQAQDLINSETQTEQIQTRRPSLKTIDFNIDLKRLESLISKQLMLNLRIRYPKSEEEKPISFSIRNRIASCSVMCGSFNSTRQTFYFCTETNIGIYRNELRFVETPEPPSFIACHPTLPSIVAVGSVYGSIFVYDFNFDDPIATVDSSDKTFFDKITGIQWIDDKRFFASSLEGFVHCFNIKGEKVFVSILAKWKERTFAITALAASKDFVALGTLSGYFMHYTLLDIGEAQLTRITFKTHISPINGVVATKNPKIYVTAGTFVYVQSILQKEPIAVIEPHLRIEDYCTCLRLSGGLLALGTSHGLYIYALNDTWNPLLVLDKEKEWTSVCWSNSTVVACSKGGEVYFFAIEGADFSWDFKLNALMEGE